MWNKICMVKKSTRKNIIVYVCHFYDHRFPLQLWIEYIVANILTTKLLLYTFTVIYFFSLTNRNILNIYNWIEGKRRRGGIFGLCVKGKEKSFYAFSLYSQILYWISFVFWYLYANKKDLEFKFDKDDV